MMLKRIGLAATNAFLLFSTAGAADLRRYEASAASNGTSACSVERTCEAAAAKALAKCVKDGRRCVHDHRKDESKCSPAKSGVFYATRCTAHVFGYAAAPAYRD